MDLLLRQLNELQTTSFTIPAEKLENNNYQIEAVQYNQFNQFISTVHSKLGSLTSFLGYIDHDAHHIRLDQKLHIPAQMIEHKIETFSVSRELLRNGIMELNSTLIDAILYTNFYEDISSIKNKPLNQENALGHLAKPR